eukprot:1085033-Rhodomonas_salina.2
MSRSFCAMMIDIRIVPSTLQPPPPHPRVRPRPRPQERGQLAQGCERPGRELRVWVRTSAESHKRSRIRAQSAAENAREVAATSISIQ